MNDPFEHHGVGNLSASSINEYIQNPARWLLHVSGYRDNIGIPAMWRGKAVDQAITAALLDDLTDDQAIHEAKEAYASDEVDALSEGLPVNQKKAQSEGEAVERYLRIALPHYRSLGKPIASQKKIMLEYDWLSVPIIGYLDLLYDGVVRDIKTVGRLCLRRSVVSFQFMERQSKPCQLLTTSIALSHPHRLWSCRCQM